MRRILSTAIALGALVLSTDPGPCAAALNGRLEGYGLRMQPKDQPTHRSWGGGAYLALTLPMTRGLVSGIVGGDYAIMMSHGAQEYDPILGLDYSRDVTQDYGRAYFGVELGQNGPGVVRPHIGMNLSRIFYSIGTTITIPNEADSEHSIVKNLSSESKAVFGYDASAGCDFNIANKAFVDLGTRYLHSFGPLPQLDAPAEPVARNNLTFYLGAGVNLAVFQRSQPGS